MALLAFLVSHSPGDLKMPNTLYIALFQYTGGEFAPMLLRCCCLTVTVGMDGLISYPEIWSLKASVRRIAACACLCDF